MNNQAQIINKIKDSENILITVGKNPSVDELTACLGLALAIDKLKKHTIAIFSGEIPPIMSFLKPEKTFEDSTASFADFIISLDKSKADKLRYRVEGDFVKIFITPYHTTISPTDLKFESGDLNVDLLIALGVTNKEDIDKAAYAHGKILHSATIATINLGQPSSFGTINYSSEVGSYSETVAGIIEQFDEKTFTKSIATALLTGIVIETGQFSNSKTTPATMSVASKLLAFGADQQLIVKEIKSGGHAAEPKQEVAQDVPLEIELEPPLTEPSPKSEAVGPEVKQGPEPYVDPLKNFMPPPLPDFSSSLSPLNSDELGLQLDLKTENQKDPAKEFTETLPPPPETTIKNSPTKPSSSEMPSQFKIPV